ncbi:MAG: hypothetical protein K6E98_05905 [Lachnospiraceae bacterium]|nr:hypothetical protein [Lachnospiraceae bacterium]
MKKNGWLLYESIDASYNRWFIEKLQKECKTYDLNLELVYTDFISDAYNMELTEIAETLIKQKSVPSFIINRSRNADISYAFEKKNIRTFNPARVTEIGNDKEQSYILAEKLGIPFMPYISADIEPLGKEYKNEPHHYFKESEIYIDIKNKASEFGYPLILKPVDGHGGKHVYFLADETALYPALQNILASPENTLYKKIILQRPSRIKGCDLRVYLINNRIITGMMRRSLDPNDFRANFSLGASASVHTLTREEMFLTGELADALPSDYIGIDFIYDKNGHPVFNEYEDVVGARMLYGKTNIDIIKLYAAHIASVAAEE